jgi:hypothetical protein
MTRQATFPKITECIAPMPPENFFTEPRMVGALAAFALITTLAIAHVHLQFMRTDMKFQQRELQKTVAELVQQQEQLKRENEAFCDRQRLAAVAQAGHMKEIEPRRQLAALIPVSIRRKYDQPLRDSAAGAIALATMNDAKARISDKILSFVDVGRANAAEPKARD